MNGLDLLPESSALVVISFSTVLETVKLHKNESQDFACFSFLFCSEYQICMIARASSYCKWMSKGVCTFATYWSLKSRQRKKQIPIARYVVVPVVQCGIGSHPNHNACFKTERNRCNLLQSTWSRCAGNWHIILDS